MVRNILILLVCVGMGYGLIRFAQNSKTMQDQDSVTEESSVPSLASDESEMPRSSEPSSSGLALEQVAENPDHPPRDQTSDADDHRSLPPFLARILQQTGHGPDGDSTAESAVVSTGSALPDPVDSTLVRSGVVRTISDHAAETERYLEPK